MKKIDSKATKINKALFKETEKERIETLLNKYSITEAAKIEGLSRQGMHDLIKRYNIDQTKLLSKIKTYYSDHLEKMTISEVAKELKFSEKQVILNIRKYHIKCEELDQKDKEQLTLLLIDHNVADASRKLNISAPQIYNKIKEYGIDFSELKKNKRAINKINNVFKTKDRVSLKLKKFIDILENKSTTHQEVRYIRMYIFPYKSILQHNDNFIKLMTLIRKYHNQRIYVPKEKMQMYYNIYIGYKKGKKLKDLLKKYNVVYNSYKNIRQKYFDTDRLQDVIDYLNEDKTKRLKDKTK